MQHFISLLSSKRKRCSWELERFDFPHATRTVLLCFGTTFQLCCNIWKKNYALKNIKSFAASTDPALMHLPANFERIVKLSTLGKGISPTEPRFRTIRLSTVTVWNQVRRSTLVQDQLNHHSQMILLNSLVVPISLFSLWAQVYMIKSTALLIIWVIKGSLWL